MPLTARFSIQENGGCAGRQSTEHIKELNQADGPGLVIHILPEAQRQTVIYSTCVTHSGVDDLVWRLLCQALAPMSPLAGCGVRNGGEEEAYNGIHSFFTEKGAHVRYEESFISAGEQEEPAPH